MTVHQTIRTLRAHGNKKNLAGMQRYNISAAEAFGVSAPAMRMIARSMGKDHPLALQLWDSGIHDAKILAALTADPTQATLTQLDRWVQQLENWAQCDVCCSEFFQKTKYAADLPFRWCIRRNEFVRRAGLVMIAVLAVHHKTLSDEQLEHFFPLIRQYSTDDRNFVKKADSWALRQIGKRNLRLQKKAIALAKEIKNIPFPAARWIAADVLGELTSTKTIAMIQRRKGNENVQ
jgi:3-methyladenine DNA glycosylase AlkD